MEKKCNEIIRILKREIQKLEEIINEMQCKFLRCEDNGIEVSYNQKQKLKKLMKTDTAYIGMLIYTVNKRDKLQEKRGIKKREKKRYRITRYTTRY